MPSCCSQCEGIESEFDRKTARRDLRRFRRQGPIPTTRLLLDELRKHLPAGASLLDIGGGIGAIHHELLEGGASSATHVDISRAYLDAARDEAARLGHGERVSFVQGDFVRLAPAVPEADVVTLDRVVCCYPDMEALLGLAAARARSVLGAVYPRGGWFTRLGIRIENLVNRLRRSDFRVYAHSPAAMDELLRSRGLERTEVRRTLVWEVVTYVRTARA